MKKIVVAIKGTDDFSMELVRIGGTLCKTFQGASLFLVYVYEVPLAFPLEESDPDEIEQADAILNRGMSAASEFAVDVETHIVQARTAGAGIISEVIDLKADALIVGSVVTSELGKQVIGVTGEYILKYAPCEVILLRPAIKEMPSDE